MRAPGGGLAKNDPYVPTVFGQAQWALAGSSIERREEQRHD
jgi:hypothetical protein